ncbi:MAG: hypothetical protein Fur005_00790 [Roseiflexaceae bacterium]
MRLHGQLPHRLNSHTQQLHQAALLLGQLHVQIGMCGGQIGQAINRLNRFT